LFQVQWWNDSLVKIKIWLNLIFNLWIYFFLKLFARVRLLSYRYLNLKCKFRLVLLLKLFQMFVKHDRILCSIILFEFFKSLWKIVHMKYSELVF
jgi:hypothetical protein